MTKVIIFTKEEVENLYNDKIVSYRQSDGSIIQFVSEECYDKLYANNSCVRVESFWCLGGDVKWKF